MTYTYEWTSVATGKPVTLTQTIDANESCYISSTLSMVLRGTTFAADCYGSDFPLVDGYREIKLLSRPGRDTMLRAKTPDAICQQILADYRAAEQAHRDHLLTDADIRYTIHDTTSYGIYNGFNGDLINSMARHYIRQLSEEFAPWSATNFSVRSKRRWTHSLIPPRRIPTPHFPSTRTGAPNTWQFTAHPCRIARPPASLTSRARTFSPPLSRF